MTFNDRIRQYQRSSQSLLCVGIDPLPAHLTGDDPAQAAADFGRRVVDATADLVCAYKPQIAHFAALGAETALQTVIDHIRTTAPDVPLILDAKRSDIASTAERYSVEAFDRYGADAVTVNPYTGDEGLEPFLARSDRGVIVLCRTSNLGADWIQTEPPDDPLFLRVAARAAKHWNVAGNVMLVAGATHAEDLRRIRLRAPDLPLLVPGIGTQEGDLAAVLRHGLMEDGTGVVINSSRGITYAGDGSSTAIRAAAMALNENIALNRP